MGIKSFTKRAIKSEPISHVVRGASTSDTIKSVIDPGEFFTKQKQGSGWYPKTTAEAAKQKINDEREKRKRIGMKEGGKVKSNVCRGGGCARRGLKFTRNG